MRAQPDKPTRTTKYGDSDNMRVAQVCNAHATSRGYACLQTAPATTTSICTTTEYTRAARTRAIASCADGSNRRQVVVHPVKSEGRCVVHAWRVRKSPPASLRTECQAVHNHPDKQPSWGAQPPITPGNENLATLRAVPPPPSASSLVAGHKDVLRLQVTVQHPPRMQGVEGQNDLDEPLQQVGLLRDLVLGTSRGVCPNSVNIGPIDFDQLWPKLWELYGG